MTPRIWRIDLWVLSSLGQRLWIQFVRATAELTQMIFLDLPAKTAPDWCEKCRLFATM